MNVLEIAVQVDARGLSCPMPIVKTAQAVRPLASGSIVEVLTTDPGSQRDFVAWCRATGHDLVEQTTEGTVHRFIIRRK
jgi:TusA-related sulfurtransferase